MGGVELIGLFVCFIKCKDWLEGLARLMRACTSVKISEYSKILVSQTNSI